MWDAVIIGGGWFGWIANRTAAPTLPLDELERCVSSLARSRIQISNFR